MTIQYLVSIQDDRVVALRRQDDALQWAQDAVTGFAVAHGRLPCPARARNGTEDCTIGAKGWLPLNSLEAAPITPGDEGRAAARYVVYRGSGPDDPDLGLAQDRYAPRQTSGTRLSGYASLINSTDLCAGLRQIAANKDARRRWSAGDAQTDTPGRSDRANISEQGKYLNVAFGIAVPADGADDHASGINADLTNMGLEPPDRGLSNSYTDRVRVVSAAKLYEQLSCTSTIASLDTLAMASGWSSGAAGWRDGNIKGGDRIATVEKMAVAASTAGLAGDSINLANLPFTIVHGATTMATGISTLNPEMIAAGLTGMNEAISALPQASIEFARSAASEAIEVRNLVVYEALARNARASYVWEGPQAIVQAADTLGVRP